MTTSIRSTLITAVSLTLASLAAACSARKPTLDDDVDRLTRESLDGNAALMRGDVDRWQSIISIADDFTLMSPFGGPPSRGPITPQSAERMRTFFRQGSLAQELIQSYRSDDLIVLVLIERAHVAVGGLSPQDWGLRVTLVYRRDAGGWRLVHRHADPLAAGISVSAAAELARGAKLP